MIRTVFAIFLAVVVAQGTTRSQEWAIKDSIALRLRDKADVFKAERNPDSALVNYRMASEIFFKLGMWEDGLLSSNNEARVHLEKGEMNLGADVLSQALVIGVENGDTTGVQMARIFELLAYTKSYMDEPDSAIALIKKAFHIRGMHQGKDGNLVVSLYILGGAYFMKGEYDESLKHLYRAKEIMDSLPPGARDEYQFQIVQALIGSSLSGKYEFKRSIDYLQNFLQNEKDAGVELYQTAEERVHFTLGECYKYLGEYSRAIKEFQRALRCVGENGMRMEQRVASSYEQLGELYLSRGDFDEALSSYRSSLQLFSKANGSQHSSVAISLHRSACAYELKGEIDTALYYATRASETYEAAMHGPSNAIMGGMFETIARLYFHKSNFPLAIEYFRKGIAMMCQSSGRDDGLDVARILSSMGPVYVQMGKPDSAQFYLNRALVMEKAGPDHKKQLRCEILRELGDLHTAQGDLRGGIAMYQQAMAAAIDSGAIGEEASGIPGDNALEVLKVLRSLSSAYELRYEQSRSTSDLLRAHDVLAQGMSTLEQLRETFRAEGSKFAIETENASVYEKAIEIEFALFRKSRDTRYLHSAFETAERSKAGVLFDALRESDAEHFAGIPDTVLMREHRLREELVQCDIEIKTSGQNPALAERRLLVSNEFHDIVDSYKRDYPAYYALRFNNDGPGLDDLRASLDDSTMLVEYHVGKRSLIIFTVDRSGLHARSVAKPANFDETVSSLGRSIRTVDSRAFVSSSSALYSLLIKPIAGQLRTNKLIIVPDGILCSVPFEALIAEAPAHNTPVNFTTLAYLIDRFDISYSYSAKTLVHDMSRPRVSSQGFLGIAPVFSDSLSSKVTLADNSFTMGMDSTLVRSVTLDGTRFNALPYSEDEVTSLASIFADHGERSVGLIHQDATEEQFKKSAGTYSYIHVATHGILDEKHPKFSALLFSSTGRNAKEDGVLYAAEAYTLDLHADLVVLSSCESGIGTMVRGEGMLSITRGFFYAGARNVMFSLWKVYDRHTNEIMQIFYSNVLDGASYASALRKAKRALINNPATAFPSKWAGFMLLGSQAIDHAPRAFGLLHEELPDAK